MCTTGKLCGNGCEQRSAKLRAYGPSLDCRCRSTRPCTKLYVTLLNDSTHDGFFVVHCEMHKAWLTWLHDGDVGQVLLDLEVQHDCGFYDAEQETVRNQITTLRYWTELRKKQPN